MDGHLDITMRIRSIISLFTILFIVSVGAIHAAELRNESTHSNQNISKGGAFSPQMLGRLEEIGISCDTPAQNQNYLIISNVRTASVAYYGGLKARDKIVNLQLTSAGYKITLERQGKLYESVLKPMYADGPDMKFTQEVEELRKAGEVSYPFSAEVIAKTRSEDIRLSSKYADSWFLACLAAMAKTPHGQQLISRMIVKTPDGAYSVVLPPGSGATIPASYGMNHLGSVSLWVSLLEECCLRNYNINNIENTFESGTKPGIQIGMQLLTGNPVTVIRADDYSPDQLSEMLSNLLSRGVPIALSAKSQAEMGKVGYLLSPNENYGLLSIDRGKNELNLWDGYSGCTLAISDMPKYVKYLAYPAR